MTWVILLQLNILGEYIYKIININLPCKIAIAIMAIFLGFVFYWILKEREQRRIRP